MQASYHKTSICMEDGIHSWNLYKFFNTSIAICIFDSTHQGTEVSSHKREHLTHGPVTILLRHKTRVHVPHFDCMIHPDITQFAVKYRP
jgi:hypothetical protein